MKQAFLFICIVALYSNAIAGVSSSPANNSIEKSSTTVQNENKLNILCFGNSFTEDSFGYVPFILNRLNPDIEVTIAIAYIGGCTLAQHMASISGEPQTIGGNTYNPIAYQQYHKSSNGEAWHTSYGIAASTILNDEEWHIITFQQGSSHAICDYSTHYEPFINNLHKIVSESIGKEVEFGWLLTHSSHNAITGWDFKRCWEMISENSQKVLENSNTTLLFPYGTAVENLRTELSHIGDGPTKNLTADGAHLQDGIGCLAAAYANALAIIEYMNITNIEIIGDDITIDSKFITDNNIPSPNLGSSGIVGISPDNIRLAQLSATEAIKKPYSITNISSLDDNYTNITESIEPTEETELYDLFGRKVTKPNRGIYILNGKKVLIR